MAIDLLVQGPINIPHEKLKKGSSKHIRKQDKKAFWADPAAIMIAPKQGCYIFALHASKGFTPWYVGKSTKTMFQECMGTYQLGLYNGLLFKGAKGTPVLFFILPPGKQKKVPGAVIDEMETYLIQSAYYQNSDLLNTKKKKIPAWTIKGIVRGGKGNRNKVETALKTMMGL